VDEMDEIVQEFLVESHENLDQLDRDLVALEQQPDSRDLLSSIFRTIHTIKGTSGFLAFGRLEKITHAGESLLARLRDGTLALTPQATDALLRTVDTVRAVLAEIEATGGEGDFDIDAVSAAVLACMEDAGAKPAAAARPAPVASGAVASGVASAAAPPAGGSVSAAVAAAPPAARPVVIPEPAAPVEPAVAAAPAAPAPAGAPPGDRTGSLESTMDDGPVWVDDASVLAQADSLPGGSEPAANEAAGAHVKRSVADSSIRVDVELLDTLMRLVGELVLTRNQLIRGVGEQENPALVRTTQRLNLITSELQESVMKTRMQPIDHLWAKLPRIVRDLSSACGKRVGLAMYGKETELDRSLLEAVKDPLTHLVRNAVDHGVETPEERLAAGKAPEGTLALRAYHEGGHVIVEVTDDGAGIAPDRVARIALDRGLVTRDQLSRMDRREIMALLFRPGFSTAKTVTNVSGRGVGMDVVKTNIERIGGAVDVESTVGVGTTWRLTIPLTLAIVQALTVECGPERYAIPQVAVHELVYLDGSVGSKIENVSGAPVYRLRGRLLPLVRLDQTLGLTVPSDQVSGYVAVLQADGRRFGLVVDRVLNTEEIVVKPLTARFKDIGVYAGATITGDGKVALILDVQSLARRSHLTAEAAEQIASLERQDEQARPSTVNRLLIAGIADRRVAIPLDMVTRLEEFPVDRVERVGNREVVQYRDQILPLVRLAHLLGAPTPLDEVAVPVVVYTERGRSVALAVEKVVDIVEDLVDTRSDLQDDGLIGSAVIQQRVTELLDVRRAILAADPMFFAETSDAMVVA
jgi:two-component system, chemotaxis family, sensor kinase CheA